MNKCHWIGDETEREVGIVADPLSSLVRPSWRPEMFSSGEAFLKLHSWLKQKSPSGGDRRWAIIFPLENPPESSLGNASLRELFIILARLPYIQTRGCKLDHSSVLCWNSCWLGCCPTVVNILIPLGNFRKEYFVSHGSHWSPFTILSSIVFGKISAEISGRHPRWACFFLSLEILSALACFESPSHPLSCGWHSSV